MKTKLNALKKHNDTLKLKLDKSLLIIDSSSFIFNTLLSNSYVMKKYLILFLIFQLLMSCNRDDYALAGESKIVVEGAIEAGDFAKVILMRSIPVGVKVDSATVSNYVVRSAKVVVSDGVNEEVLS